MKGFHPESNDWYWVKYMQDGEIEREALFKKCTLKLPQCKAAGRDVKTVESLRDYGYSRKNYVDPL